jgi:hypothetical protein
MKSPEPTTRLYLPPSLRYFDVTRVTGGPPARHTALVYDLVEAIHPGLLVDLGAGNARAFVAACQSLRDHDVDGLAYAVDSWASADGETGSPDAVNQMLHAHFRGVAYVLKVAPRDALVHFEPRSIDLLRVDVSRIGEPLDSLLDAWLPRIADDGVLVCAGISQDRGAEAALRERLSSPLVVFSGDGGLAVSVLSSRVRPSPLVELLRSEVEEDRADLVRFYAHADEHAALSDFVATHGDRLVQRKPGGGPGNPSGAKASS